MWDLVADLRFAVRQLRSSPGFGAAAIATIALGVGATTAVFGAVDGVLLRPLPFPGSERAVVFCEEHPRLGDACVASPPNVADWGRLAASLAEVGVARTWTYAWRERDGQTSLTAGIASPGYLRVHGARPHLGRLLAESDMPAGSNRVVVLTHALWRSRFAADPKVLGRRIVLDDEPFTIVGVLAPDTWLHEYGWVQAWAPVTATPDDPAMRQWRGFTAVGLLAEGVGLAAVRQELAGVRAALAAEHPADNEGWGLSVAPMRDRVAGRVRPVLAGFAAAVVCVLLVGCANVANLLLVRATERGGELAVRAALGAGRGRLVRQALAESALLAVTGGALGLGLAVLAVDGLVALAPPGVPRLDEVGIDLRVAAFAVALSLVTAVLCGLAPALRAAGVDPIEGLRSVRHGVPAAARRVRDALVVGQMAAALVLLVAAGLIGRSFAGLLAWEPGFDRRGLVVAWASANAGAFDGGREVVAAFERLADDLRAVPGVSAVGQSSAGPVFGGVETASLALGAAPPPPDERPAVRWYDVDPAYFAALGVPVVRGRSFRPGDDAGAPPVAIVNQTLVARHLGGAEPIGALVTIDDSRREIVGVVGDMAPYPPGATAAAEVYYPKRQVPRLGTWFVVRTDLAAAALERQVRERLERDHPQIALSPWSSLDDRAREQRTAPRFGLALLSALAAVALALAAIGVYGVTAYGVARRTHEIGLRIALGAEPAAIGRSVLLAALGLAALGLAIGVAAALAGGRLIAAQLHGVSSRDPATYAAVALLVLAAAAAASSFAARRAARLDPVAALRAP